MPSTIQRTFAGGELAPDLHGRADQTKYQTGLRTCRNAFVQRFGGIANRSGTGHVAEVKDSDTAVLLLPFIFSDDQACLLELGDEYMRFVVDGGQVVVTGVAAWSSLTAYEAGDLVERLGVNYYCIAANTGETPPSTDYWYALTGDIFEIPTPYAAEDLSLLKFAQDNDVVTFVHPDYPVYDLSRFGATDWTLEEVAFISQAETPVNIEGTGEVGGNSYEYMVTAVAQNGEESLPGTTGELDQATITDITETQSPVITTTPAHGFTTGMRVLLASISGGVGAKLNNRTFTINVLSSTTFELRGVSLVIGYSYVSGGTATVVGIGLTNVKSPATDPITLTWDAVDEALEYRVYRSIAGVMGFIGIALENSFIDRGYDPDTLDNPPEAVNPYQDESPGAVGYLQQRLVLGGGNERPKTFRGSSIGFRKNFNKRRLLHDDDAYEHEISGKAQRIRHIIDLGRMILMTSAGSFLAAGDQNGIVTPTAPGLKLQGSAGCSHLPPIILDRQALFVHALGSSVRSLSYDLQADGYNGRELSIFGAHLFAGHEIVSWTWSESQACIWAVRDDGELLGCTHVPEHEITGWHHHDTGDGDAFEQVCAIPEGTESAVYVVVRRTIDGETRRYIERFTSRNVTDIAVDAIFVDCSATYDGRNDSAVTMTLTGGTDWTYDETLTLTASAATFDSADGETRDTFTAANVGAAIILRAGDEAVRVVITAFVSATEVEVHAEADVPAALQGVAVTDWDKAIAVITGLSHLEGRTVSALADGDVTTDLTVTGGTVTVPRPGGVVHVGLPIVSDMETLDLEVVNGETLSDKKKSIKQLTVRVKDTRGLFVGDSEDSTLRPVKALITDEEPIPLFTGNFRVAPVATWNEHGRVFIRQTEPLPFTVLAITPAGDVGGG